MTQKLSSITNKTVIVFDLDDTIYKEIEYLKSAYNEIAAKIAPIISATTHDISTVMIKLYEQGENVFEYLTREFDLPYSITDLLNIYRKHIPQIDLTSNNKELFEILRKRNIALGILTDGRTLTQKNKIKALGLDKYVKEEDIIISEEFGYGKPSTKGYEYFMGKYPSAKFYYIGDNPKKDFIAPNLLRWTTIGLKDNGMNIHKQIETNNEYQPQIIIEELNQILEYI